MTIHYAIRCEAVRNDGFHTWCIIGDVTAETFIEARDEIIGEAQTLTDSTQAPYADYASVDITDPETGFVIGIMAESSGEVTVTEYSPNAERVLDVP